MEKLAYDIAVVGGGGAGVAAALRSAQLGRRVLLLEKAASIGGSAAMCRGIGAVGSRTQEADPGCNFTVEDLFQEFMRQTSYLADNALIYQFLSNSGETVDWLQENGCKMDYVGNAQEKHIGSKFKTFFNWGPEKIREMRTMMEEVVRRGGQVLTGTAAKSLLVEDGRVVGLLAENRAGERMEVRARAVILCSGGYGNNEEMVLRATRGVKVNRINSGGQTGDGINMGLAAGAAAENLDAIEFHGISLPFEKVGKKSAYGTPGVLGVLSRLPALLWVNQAGNRFASEAIIEDISYAGNTAFRQGSQFYALLDSAMVRTLETEGICALGAEPFADGPLQGNVVCTGLLREIEEGYGRTLTYHGDTLEELARATGVPAARLQETVARYNAFCHAGRDGMYGKDRRYLFALETPPFYAVEIRAAELCSLGSLKIDLDFRVVDTQGEAIPGLYAAGCDASGGLFNNAYVSLEGMTIGWAFTSGRLAGERAAAFAGGDRTE